MRNSIRALTAAAAVALSAPIIPAQADGTMQVHDAWSRAMPAVARNGAAYLSVSNPGGQDDRLVSAESPIAAKVELHSVEMKDGVMKMRPVPSIDVPAGGSATLEPGGLHVMMMGLQQPLEAGKSFPLTLRFEHAEAVTVEVPVSAGEPMKHAMPNKPASN